MGLLREAWSAARDSNLDKAIIRAGQSLTKQVQGPWNTYASDFPRSDTAHRYVAGASFTALSQATMALGVFLRPGMANPVSDVFHEIHPAPTQSDVIPAIRTVGGHYLFTALGDAESHRRAAAALGVAPEFVLETVLRGYSHAAGGGPQLFGQLVRLAVAFADPMRFEGDEFIDDEGDEVKYPLALFRCVQADLLGSLVPRWERNVWFPDPGLSLEQRQYGGVLGTAEALRLALEQMAAHARGE